MDHLTFTDGSDNMGGARAFRFCPIEDIDTLPITVDGIVTGDPDFNPGGDWYEGYVTQDTADFDEREEVKDGGPLWQVTFIGFVPCDTAEQRANIDDIVRHHHIVDVIDNNGLTRRMGSLRNPARITARYTTGRTASDRNGYTLTIRWTHDASTPIVEEDSGSGSFS